jgi:formylglycine-generating enzyme required for sulfatase activity
MYSCGTSKVFHKQRIKKGNDLTFIFFKKGEVKNDPYFQFLKEKYPNMVDSMTIYYLGGQTEVTNKQYWKFLSYLKLNDPVNYEFHKPKTQNWKAYSNDFNIADSLSQYYDSLNLYGSHPVVNISPENALAFVNWLNKIEPDTLVSYRLFTKTEWLILFNDKPEIDSSFAWGGNNWRNNNNAPLGNYAEFNQDQIRYNHLSDKISWEKSDSVGFEADVNGPMNVWSYNPNCWGAWNLSGNVAELTDNYFKIDSIWYCKTNGGSWHSPVFYLRKFPMETYKLPSPYVGFRVLKTQIKPKVETGK